MAFFWEVLSFPYLNFYPTPIQNVINTWPGKLKIIFQSIGKIVCFYTTKGYMTIPEVQLFPGFLCFSNVFLVLPSSCSDNSSLKKSAELWIRKKHNQSFLCWIICSDKWVRSYQDDFSWEFFRLCSFSKPFIPVQIMDMLLLTLKPVR